MDRATRKSIAEESGLRLRDEKHFNDLVVFVEGNETFLKALDSMDLTPRDSPFIFVAKRKATEEIR